MLATDTKTPTQGEIESLRRAIEVRKAFLGRVVPSILELIRKYGKVEETKRENSYTNAFRALREFGGFDFILDEGHSEMGGSSLEVRSLGGKDARGGWAMKLSQTWPIFETDDNWLDATSVRGFVNESLWQDALEHTLEESEALIEKMRARDEAERINKNSDAYLRREFAALRQEAIRYGISAPE